MHKFHKGKMRRFVENFFGRGTASARHTTNIMTLGKATENQIKRKLNLLEALVISSQIGAHLRQGERGNRHLIYTKKGDARTFVHELAHTAHERKRKPINPPEISKELLANLVEFEYMKEKLPEEYKDELQHTEAIDENNPGSIGRCTSRIIHNYPFTPEERIQIIKELVHKDFHSIEELSNWLNPKLQAKIKK